MRFRLIPASMALATRTLRREPVFLATAVLSLAVAIALNTVMYGVFDAMFNPRAAGSAADRMLTARYYGDVAHRLERDAIASALATGGRTYDGVTGFRSVGGSIEIATRDRAREIDPLVIRPDFFDVIGLRPVEGRVFAASAGEQQSIVISDRLRGELFPGVATVVGSTVIVDGRASTIAAVVRRYAGFSVLDADVWVVAGAANGEYVPANLLRMRRGATRADVEGELATLAARLALAAGESSRDSRFLVRSVVRAIYVWTVEYALAGGVLAILLVACANLGNMQFARGLNRARELAVRSAIGASRAQIVRLLLSEVAVLATAGLVVGAVLSDWAVGALRASIPNEVSGIVIAPDVSWRMGAFAAVVALVCIVLVGLAPAIRASRVDLNALIKSGAGTGAHREHRRRYGWLVIAQIGLTLPVVSAAVLLGRAAVRMSDPTYGASRYYGFDPESVVVAHITIPGARNQWVQLGPVAQRLISDAKAIPGVTSAAVQVFAQTENGAVSVTDGGRTTEIAAPMWSYELVTPEYFRAIGFPIESGRDFADGAHDQSAVIVDRLTAAFAWPQGVHADAMIKFGDARSNAPWLMVRGVRGDHLDAEARRYIAWIDTLKLVGAYRVLTTTDSVRAGSKGVALTLYARAPHAPQAAAIALRARLRRANLSPPPAVAWMPDDMGISSHRTRQRFMLDLFGGGAVICLALAALGVYGIVSQSIAQRRREIAVRISLGARPGDIVGMILREGNVFALAGILMGLMLTVYTVGWLGYFLGERERMSAFYLALSGATLFALAGLAALTPALTAARIDPVDALKSD